jgi:hypothetical protein
MPVGDIPLKMIDPASDALGQRAGTRSNLTFALLCLALCRFLSANNLWRRLLVLQCANSSVSSKLAVKRQVLSATFGRPTSPALVLSSLTRTGDDFCESWKQCRAFGVVKHIKAAVKTAYIPTYIQHQGFSDSTNLSSNNRPTPEPYSPPTIIYLLANKANNGSHRHCSPRQIEAVLWLKLVF